MCTHVHTYAIKWTLKYTLGGHVCTTQKSSEFVTTSTLSFIEKLYFDTVQVAGV